MNEFMAIAEINNKKGIETGVFLAGHPDTMKITEIIIPDQKFSCTHFGIYSQCYF